jgi:predicted amidohydrolase YtcJ
MPLTLVNIDLSATLAIVNANIKTMDPKQPTAQALAIAGNKIIKVGSNSDIAPLIGKNTRVLHLEDKTVLPGLIDTHIHVADYGRCLMWLDLTSAKSIAELQTLIREKAKLVPAGRWIIGQGWNETHFQEQHPPTVADLDEAAPDNPVILYREAAMICAANTKAIQLAGVTQQTPPPAGGAIDKTADGKLAGVFRDTAANLIWQAVPEPTEDELLEATAYACQKIFQAGITSLNWLVISENELSIIQKLHEQDRLMFRVNVVVPEALLEKAVAIKSRNHEILRVSGAFIVTDGYLDSKEAALLKPYSDDPANSGKMLLTQEQLEAQVKRALTFGVQPVIHAMGDKAIDATLSAIEKTNKADVRFRIEQAAVLNKPLIKRLKQQNVVITIQPKVITTEFAVWSANQRLGNRARLLHPLKTLLDEGVKVAAGSDCPMEPLSALLGVQEMITRQSYPEQRLSLDEALRLYTLNAAYSSGEESLKGSIEEGKLADLTILSNDLSQVSQGEIKDVAVDFVVLNGMLMVVT